MCFLFFTKCRGGISILSPFYPQILHCTFHSIVQRKPFRLVWSERPFFLAIFLSLIFLLHFPRLHVSFLKHTHTQYKLFVCFGAVLSLPCILQTVSSCCEQNSVVVEHRPCSSMKSGIFPDTGEQIPIHSTIREVPGLHPLS